jgi:hypothetical protein
MKKVLGLMFALLLSSGLTGCGSSATKNQLAAVNEMTSILEGIKDDKSAEEALPKLEKAADNARTAGEKIVSGGAMSESEAAKYAKEIMEAQVKMQAAAMKAAMAAKGKSKQITEALAKAQPKNVKLP